MGPKPWIRKVWTSRGHLLAEKRAISMVLDVFLSSLSGNRQVELIRTEISGRCLFCRSPKGQLISKRLLEKIVWTKIATKKFDNFCPGGQIKKIKTLYYIKYPIIDIRKCLYFFDLTTRAEIVKFFRCYFGPNNFFQKAF